MEINQPLPCLVKLIEQPTWGGRFILELKGLGRDPAWQNKKIGQSYELFWGTQVIINGKQIPINNLLTGHGPEILGRSVFERFGPKMPLLLKLTQAKDNSYQIHLPHRVKHPRWQPKAEAWYYFETGLLTLGVKENISWNDYEKTVKAVQAKMETLSRQAGAGKLQLDEARTQASRFIKTHNPADYVNYITAQSGEVWDLSSGGLHHSWEEDEQLAPHGNVLFEIQEDVPDEISSIRAFDKGKVKDDGSIRAVHIDNYFQFIDRSPKTNYPDLARHQPKTIAETSGGRVEQLLATPYYTLELMVVKHHLSGASTNTQDRFHHLFVKTGSVRIDYGRNRRFKLTQGSSVLIPGCLGEYELTNQGKNKAEVIKSFII